MLNKKILLSLSLLAITVFKGYAQNGGATMSSALDHSTVAQEDLLSILSKSEVGYNGLPDISIPIYTVKMDGTEIPIILRYNPNATRVDNKASWVGFGWDLDIGGNVSRVVNGTPDDVVITDRHGLVDDLPSNNRLVQPIYGYGVLGAKKIQDYDWESDPNTPYKKALLFKNLSNTSGTWGTRMGIYNNSQAINSNSAYGALFVASAAGNNNWQNSEGIDTEPDVFSYDLFGKRGKFIFHYSNPLVTIGGGGTQNTQAATTADLQMEAVTIPYDNISVKWELDPATLAYTGDISQKYNLRYPFQTGGAQNFEIKDDNGRVFTFSVLDSTFVTHQNRKFAWHIGCGIHFRVNNEGNDRLNLVMKYTSKWSVQQVKTANGRIINFDYYKDNTYSYSSFSKSIPQSDLNNYDGINQMNEDATKTLYGQINNKIKRIETDKEIILFILSNTKRLDDRNSYSLDKIIVYEKASTEVVEKFRTEFNYDYFSTNSDNQYDNRIGFIPPMRPEGIDYEIDAFDKKLKLTGITFKSGSEIIPYTFTYNNGVNAIPRYASVKQDLYGYYNNASENNNFYLYPKLYVYPNKSGIDKYTINRRIDWANAGELEYTLSGCNRESNSNMDIATLKRINNPFGGYVEYVFEPNEYLWPSGNIKGGGMRSKVITMNPGIVGLTNVIRTFTYRKTNDDTKSSGKLLHYPIVAMGENHCGYNSSDYSFTQPNAYPRTSLDYIKKFTWRLENPSFNGCVDAGESIVGYNEITETTPTGQTGEKVTSYWLPGGAESTGIENSFAIQNTGLETVSNSSPITRLISGGGYYESPISSGNGKTPPPGESVGGLPVILDVYSPIDVGGLDFSPYSIFSGATVNLSWARGLISSIKYYDNLERLILEKNMKYKLFTPSEVVSIPCLKQGVSQNYSTSNYDAIDHKFAFNNKYYSYYKQIANVKMVLESVTTKDFGQAGNTASVDVSQKYEYPSVLPAKKDPYPRKTTTINSDGDTYISNFRYPSDFEGQFPAQTSNTLGGIPALINGGKYSSLVESWQELIKNGATTSKVISAVLLEYNVFPNASNVGASPYRGQALTTDAPISDFVPSYISNNGSVLSKDSRYTTENIIMSIDNFGNPLEVKSNRISASSSNIMGYTSLQPIAIAHNATYNDIAYCGFDEEPYAASGIINEAKGNWDFNPLNIASDLSCPTSERVYALTTNNQIISVNNLQTGRQYVLGFWTRNINGNTTPPDIYNGNTLLPTYAALFNRNNWWYYEIPVTGTWNKIKISTPSNAGLGGVYIDDVRLYPIGASMQTFTYDKKFGKPLSVMNSAGKVTSFEYDDFGRSKTVKNEKGQIIQANTYKYQVSQ